MVRGRGQEGLALHMGPPHGAKHRRSLAEGMIPRESNELTASEHGQEPQSMGRSDFHK